MPQTLFIGRSSQLSKGALRPRWCHVGALCALYPCTKQAQLKVCNYKFRTMALFVIYAHFESILEPLGRQTNHTTYTKQHKVCAAAAILCLNPGRYNQFTVIKVGEKSLTEFVNVLIKLKTAIIKELRINRPMKRMSAQKRVRYETATQCYICRHAFDEDDPKWPKIRDHNHITKFFIGAAHRLCNFERPVSFRIPVFFYNFRGYDAHLIVHEVGKIPEREIKVIGQNTENYLQIK